MAWRADPGLWGKVANDDRSPCPIRFQGQWEDEESGLHYNRFRYYDPEATQYLSPDPIGLRGGVRPQGYVEDPNGWIDPLGLAGCSNRLRANMMEDMGLPRSTRAPGYQAQHLVPGALSNHPAFRRSGLDIDAASNGQFLPNTRADVSPMARHQGSHDGYNRAVEASLDRIDLNQSPAQIRQQIEGMQGVLRQHQQNGLPVRPRDWPPEGGAIGNQRAFDRWDRVLRDAGY